MSQKSESPKATFERVGEKIAKLFVLGKRSFAFGVVNFDTQSMNA